MAIETGKRAVCDVCGTKSKWVQADSSWTFAVALTGARWSTDHHGWERLLCPKCKDVGDSND